MLTDSITPTPVQKEYIAALHFPPNEVLSSLEEIKQRRADIERSRFLGNAYRSKVIIHFRDSEGYKQVETTIWAVTDTKVVLKNNMSIPINRIFKVKIQTEDLRYPSI